MQDYKSPYQVFNFESWSRVDNTLEFVWSFDDGQISFTEKLIWPEATSLPVSKVFDRAAELYHLMAGVSYYKLFPTKKMEVHSFDIDREQAIFVEDLYRQGLGEYLYVNQLNPNILGKFDNVNEQIRQSTNDYSGEGSHVLIGGGKDSLVSTDLLKKAKKDFMTFRVNSNPWIDNQLEKIGAPSSKIVRRLDPQLFSHGQTGALNGHVPVTAIISAAAVLNSIVEGKSTIIVSNEASANIPNVEYAGMQINHQFSKSLELETEFAKYIEQYISPSIKYFSLLRPWTELKIVEYFCNNLFDEYSGLWSSSNDNFKQGNDPSIPSWDVSFSPKTLSIFGLFAAFVKADKLVPEMGGDYFESDEYSKTWDELVGNIGIKPLECVADIDEMRLAIKMAVANGWEHAKKIEVGDPVFDYKNNREHRIPDEFKDLVG